MIDLDGTPGEGRLGANAIVGVSMALARALATPADVPLWRWLTPDGVAPCLPVPHFNVLNGGVHAPNELDFQEFMVAPLGAPSMAEAEGRRTTTDGSRSPPASAPRWSWSATTISVPTRLRAAEIRRANPRRAGRQVQPPDRDRRRRARTPLRHVAARGGPESVAGPAFGPIRAPAAGANLGE